MSYELAIIGNPRKRKVKRASKAQLAARRKFVAKFAKGRKARGKRKAAKSTNSGVSAMAKRKKRRSPARTAKGRFVKKSHKARKHVTRKKRRSSGGTRRAAAGYTVGTKRIRRRKLNPRGARRRYKRNPLGLGSVSGIINGQIIPAAYGAAGGIALNLALSYLPLPDSLKTGWMRHGVRVLGALGLGLAAKKFMGAKGSQVAAGAMTIVVYDVLKAALAQFAPEIGSRLGDFEDVSLEGGDYYDPASYISNGGVAGYLDGSPGDGDVDDMSMGAYMEGDLDGVGAYMEGGDI